MRKFRKIEKKPNNPINIWLVFRDKTLESSFNEGKFVYQSNVSLLSNLLLIFFSMILWSMDKDPLRWSALIFNILKPPSIIIFLYCRKKYPKHMETIVISTMLPFTLVTIENLSTGSGTPNTLFNSFLNGLYFEVFCVLWLLLKISWRKTIILLIALHSIMISRNISGGSYLDYNMRLLQVTLANLVFLILFSYSMEKNERIRFLEVKQKESSLTFFQNFIQDSLPLGVLVLNKSEILFCNQESKRLLGIHGREMGMEDLKSLELEENELSLELLSDNHLDRKANSYKSSLQIFLNTFTRSGRKNTNNFVGRRLSTRKEEKNQKFNVKVDKIIWKKEFATIITLIEDINAVKLEYVQQYEIFKDRVLGSVSHQFRTPLNAVMGILETVSEAAEDQQVKESLEIAMSASQRLLSLINDILDFSQMNLGKFSLNISSFSIESALKEIMLIFEAEAKKKHIEFHLENRTPGLGEHTNINIFSNDQTRLKQILSNLLSNAFKFTTHGSVKIFYELFSPNKEREDDLKLRISIEDTGCGIREDMLTRLFDFFGKVQEREYKNLNTDGIGFGLAISHRLLMAMNNYEDQAPPIKVKSTVGEGSIFSFEIKFIKHMTLKLISHSNDLMPIDEIMEEDPPVESILNYNMSFGKSTRVGSSSEFVLKVKRKKKILIVDDDAVNIMVLSRYLKSCSDIEFSTASNGLEALVMFECELATGTSFDLVLMDCNMPVMDGYEATLKLKELFSTKFLPDIPIIAVTANVLTSDLEKCLDYGMTDYLTKPLTKTQLLEKIKKYLDLA